MYSITGFYIYRGSHIFLTSHHPSVTISCWALSLSPFGITWVISSFICLPLPRWRRNGETNFRQTKKCESCKSAALFFSESVSSSILWLQSSKCFCLLLLNLEAATCSLIGWQLNTNCSPAWHVGETLQKFFHDPILSSGCVGKATCQQWWSKLNKSHKLAGWFEYDKICQSFWALYNLYIYTYIQWPCMVYLFTLGWYIQSIGLDR